MRGKKRDQSARRRGAVVVYAAMSLTTLLGFAAISIDVGYLYMVRGQLQVAADAAALAAAGELSAIGDSTKTTAKQYAAEYSSKNFVLGEPAEIDPEVDVIFGMATLDPQTGRYTFAPNTDVTDAVCVRVRRTSDSPRGAVPLFFANIFGISEKDMYAQAIAILIPRDIAIVADLSASHNDDSELRHINLTTINMWDVWAALPGGLDKADEGYSPQNAGPTWGTWMEQAGFGELTLDSSYNPTSDSGLVYLMRGQNWNNATIEGMLHAQGYNEDEVDAIMSATYDGTTSSWKARVAVALGLAVWRSGMPPDGTGQPGKWQTDGLAPGNGNRQLTWSSELTWVESYPYAMGSWSEYLDYMKSSSTHMVSEGNPAFKYRFGVKTFLNYVLEKRRSYHETPELHATPAQPMQAVKDAVSAMMGIITDLQTDDQVSLESYCTNARHEMDLTQDYASIAAYLNNMQAGHYEPYTNMGGGIQRGIEELSSQRARAAAVKVMILLTDGKANVTEDGTVGDYTNGPIYALAKAREAAALGIRIYAVSVGADSDIETMDEVAEIGSGSHFHAEGSISEYSEQLEAIFQTLGGKRPVMLID